MHSLNLNQLLSKSTKRLVIVLLSIALIANCIGFINIIVRKDYTRIFASDFANYYTGMLLLKDNPNNLYNTQIQYDTQHSSLNTSLNRVVGNEHKIPSGELAPYRALPSTALLYSLFVRSGDYLDSYFHFVLINVALLAVSTIVAIRYFRNAFLTMLIILGALPTLATFINGQPSFILFLLLLTALIQIKTGRYFLAGVILSGMLIKTNYILLALLVVLATERKLAYLAGLVAGVLVVILVNVQLVGVTLLLSYPSFVFGSETNVMGSNPHRMFTLHSIFNLTGSSATQTAVTSIFVLTPFVIAIMQKSRNIKYKKEYLFVFCTILGTLLSIHLMIFDLLILFPGLLLMVKTYQKDQKEPAAIVVAILLYISPYLFVLTGSAATSAALHTITLAIILFRENVNYFLLTKIKAVSSSYAGSHPISSK